MTSSPTVLIADDDAEVLALFERERQVEVVLTDLRMPRLDGLGLTRAVKERSPRTEVLIMTAFVELESAIQAIRVGAHVEEDSHEEPGAFPWDGREAAKTSPRCRG